MSENEILTIIKDRVVFLRKLTRNNPNLDLVNVNAYAKFHQFVLKILSGNKVSMMESQNGRSTDMLSMGGGSRAVGEGEVLKRYVLPKSGFLGF